MLIALLFAGEWVLTPDPIPAPAAGWGAFVEDMDGDGVAELGSVSHGTLPVWVEARSGLAAQAHPFTWKEREDRHGMLPCDVNGDGSYELVVAMGGGKGTKGSAALILWREGESWRKEELPETRGVRMRGVSCLDLDGDAQPELYFPGHGQKSADVLLVQDGGVWVDRAPEMGLDRVGNTFGGLWEDLDGDGDLDMVRLEDNQVVILWQDQGHFSAEPLQAKAVRDIALGDVDNDGDQDLYLARAGFFNDAVGDHGARLHLKLEDRDAVGWQFPDTCEQAFIRAQGDFKGAPARMKVADGREQQQFSLTFGKRYEDIPDGDGLLVWVEPTGHVVNVLAMGLEGRVTLNLECKKGEGAPRLLVSDIEQRRPTERQDILLLNEGGSFVAGVLPEAPDVSTAHAQFVDVDLDADLDLFLVTESTPGTLDNAPDLLWLNDGTGSFSPAPGWPELPEEPPVEGQFGVAADLDGDRYPELLSFNGAYPRVQAGHVQLWTNPGGDNGWIQVRALDGNAVSLSARIVVKADGVSQSRLSNPHPDFRSNGTQGQVFGIGQATKAKVIVTWPDGKRTVLRRVRPGTVVEVSR